MGGQISFETLRDYGAPSDGLGRLTLQERNDLEIRRQELAERIRKGEQRYLHAGIPDVLVTSDVASRRLAE